MRQRLGLLGVVEGALGPSFLFWGSSEKVVSWTVLESAEIPNHFQSMI